MKIVAINGSPKGKMSNTNVMVSAFLRGAQEAGAKTENIFLAEKEIKHCRGCHSCWFESPGQCVNNDDMLEVLSPMGGANIIILATPVYFENISGMLKVFMDRLTMIGNPHAQKAATEERRQSESIETLSPRLMMISNCGFPDRSEFQVISHWIKRVALKMGTEVIAEIYAAQGKLLTAQGKDVKSIISNYIRLLEKAGKEIAIDMKLSKMTVKLLEKNFIPNDIFMEEAKRDFGASSKN